MMELTIENLRTLAQSGQIFSDGPFRRHGFYERGILLADIRQAIQGGKIIEYRPDDYRCPSCLVLGSIWQAAGCMLSAAFMRALCGF